jgi:hypothetical protein
MKRMIVCGAALAMLAACAGSGGGSGGAAECPMKSTEEGKWCGACKMMCGPDCPTDDKGMCKMCGKAPVDATACVAYKCTAHNAMHGEPCGEHASKSCCKKVMAPIVCACGEVMCPGSGCPKCKEAGGCKKKCKH